MRDESQAGERLFRIGFYANESTRCLDVMVEIFHDDRFYNDRFREMYNPEFMQSPIDYYLMHKVQPKVLLYSVGVCPVLNGCYIDYAPLLFEKGDNLDIKFFIQRHGPVGFN